MVVYELETIKSMFSAQGNSTIIDICDPVEYNFPNPHAAVDVLILNNQDIRFNGAVNRGVSKEIIGRYHRSTSIKEIKMDLAKFCQVRSEDFSLTQRPMANYTRLSSNNLMTFADNACIGELFNSTHPSHRTMPNFGIQWK